MIWRYRCETCAVHWESEAEGAPCWLCGGQGTTMNGHVSVIGMEWHPPVENGTPTPFDLL